MVFSAHVHHGMDYAESPEILEDDDEGHQKGLPPRHKVNMTNFSLQKNQKDKASLKQQSEFQSYILHQVMPLNLRVDSVLQSSVKLEAMVQSTRLSVSTCVADLCIEAKLC